MIGAIIGKRHRIKFHGTLRSAKRPGVSFLDDFGCFVKDLQRSFGTCKMRLHVGYFFPQRLQRVIQLTQISHHQEEFTQDAWFDKAGEFTEPAAEEA